MGPSPSLEPSVHPHHHHHSGMAKRQPAPHRPPQSPCSASPAPPQATCTNSGCFVTPQPNRTSQEGVRGSSHFCSTSQATTSGKPSWAASSSFPEVTSHAAGILSRGRACPRCHCGLHGVFPAPLSVSHACAVGATAPLHLVRRTRGGPWGRTDSGHSQASAARPPFLLGRFSAFPLPAEGVPARPVLTPMPLQGHEARAGRALSAGTGSPRVGASTLSHRRPEVWAVWSLCRVLQAPGWRRSSPDMCHGTHTALVCS